MYFNQFVLVTNQIQSIVRNGNLWRNWISWCVFFSCILLHAFLVCIFVFFFFYSICRWKSLTWFDFFDWHICFIIYSICLFIYWFALYMLLFFLISYFFFHFEHSCNDNSLSTCNGIFHKLIDPNIWRNEIFKLIRPFLQSIWTICILFGIFFFIFFLLLSLIQLYFVIFILFSYIWARFLIANNLVIDSSNIL